MTFKGQIVEPELKKRSDVAVADTWDLSQLCASDEVWRKDFDDWKLFAEKIVSYRGKLADVETLVEFLKYEEELDRKGERLGTYAFLKSTEDLADSTYQEMKSEFYLIANKVAEESSFVRPELLGFSSEKWDELMNDERLSPWKLKLERILRFKPYSLSDKEERILASVGDVADAPSKAFRLLNDAETKFKPTKDESGNEAPLTLETLQLFLHSSKRSVRQEAFENLYQEYEARQNTFAALLEGSIRKDVFYAKARGFSSVLQASMFTEEIPEQVYKNLLEGVRGALPALYRYYELRRKLLKLDNIHFYDVYVPVVSDVKVDYTWNSAVELIGKALAPLGEEYVSTLTKGLTTDRWVDRYENLNKESGAFSCPGYDSPPYILTNFKSSTIESVFTLAHEGGHSMHSWYSAKNQPYRYYDYVIFLAEIASTFNEQLLARYLLKNAGDDKMRAWIINRELDSIRTTIFRQTMFSEFEFRVHELAEANQPLSASIFRRVYREILDQYFGPDFVVDDLLELECLRIPHFYRGYYVYKYATGLSAAISLADRVLDGGVSERDAYLGFLKSGASAKPLEILNGAGVDMEKKDAIQAAMKRFEKLTEELDSLLS
ncbi:MAG: oligoendopeptidase F [Thermoguttaceae bacterium]|nr:oligoendopeptidase F [Thermoguttaceae bacterium]